jgi:hypothetical protein
MPFLTAAVVLVGALCLVDLLLSLGVVRRLREEAKLVAGLAARVDLVERAPVAMTPRPSDRTAPHAVPPASTDRPAGSLAPVGRLIDPFSTRTVDGEPVSRDTLPPKTTVIFLAADCSSCRARVPDVVRWARAQPRQRILVLVDALVADPGAMVAALREVARVVVEADGPAVTDAFGVGAFPSYCVVDGGEVVSAASGVPTQSVSVAGS